MTRRWNLFRLLGIPIRLDVSWLIILALLTWTLAGDFQERVPGLTTASYWALGLGISLAFFGCILLHELGHAVVARATGLPVRGITLFLFGGVAELGREPKSAGREFVMAIAGPVVSALLAAAFGLLALLGGRLGWPASLLLVLGYLAGINLCVLVFNLVPAFPLDGGRVLRSLLWALLGSLLRATYWAALLGQAFAWLLIACGVFRLLQGVWGDGIWLGFIGLFLNNAARASYQQVVVREGLRGERVRRLMRPRTITVSPTLTLREWVEDYVKRYHRKTFPVVSEGHLEGIVGTRALARFPRAEWHRHTVAEVMRHDLRRFTIQPGAGAWRALKRMQRTGLKRLLVAKDGRLLGTVGLKELLRFLEVKSGPEHHQEAHV